jgi:rare lipoprotein A
MLSACSLLNASQTSEPNTNEGSKDLGETQTKTRSPATDKSPASSSNNKQQPPQGEPVPNNSENQPASTFVQTGVASWYGGKFHGRKTASGERFNENALTAAHRTLRFGTWVEVENLRNGKKVKVRINDRGPFTKGRIIDLSQAAAQKIGLSGVGQVRISITTPNE